MRQPLILASTSPIRSRILTDAAVPHHIEPARVDEVAIRAALQAENLRSRDIADALAEAKAQKVSLRQLEALVIGCDQVLDLDGDLFSKPEDQAESRAQLARLSGKVHKLYAAMVVCEAGRPVWRHIGETRMHVRALSPGYIDGYVTRNWDSIRHTPGSYLIEGEGARLFSRIEGDHFAVLGLPLFPFLSWLTLRGILEI